MGPFLAKEPSDSRQTARPFRKALARNWVVSETANGREYFRDFAVGADPSSV
jgi:hypothetical protein